MVLNVTFLNAIIDFLYIIIPNILNINNDVTYKSYSFKY